MKKIYQKLSHDISSVFVNNLKLVLKGYEKVNMSYNEEIYISETALADALDEICKDLTILNYRRNAQILTRGKLAGVILFRLSRWQIISTSNQELLEDRIFSNLNFLIPFCVALNYVNIKYENIEEIIRTEILYSISRRHNNQETLGLVLDILKNYIA